MTRVDGGYSDRLDSEASRKSIRTTYGRCKRETQDSQVYILTDVSYLVIYETIKSLINPEDGRRYSGARGCCQYTERSECQDILVSRLRRGRDKNPASGMNRDARRLGEVSPNLSVQFDGVGRYVYDGECRDV
ncbi:hypothetical protein Trydic_g18928 [Trypoxylus dichotomus]